MTTQKKVLLIRENDFRKFEKSDRHDWDKIEFRPVTREWLQKQATWFHIKGNKNIAIQFQHWPYPSEWVRRTNITKFQENYGNWLYRWDDTGVLRVRASLGQPEHTMGILIMERIQVVLDDELLLDVAADEIDQIQS